MGKVLSQQDKQFIIDHPEMSYVEIGKLLNRRADFISGWARKLGLTKLVMDPWYSGEEYIIKKYFPSYGAVGCKKYLNFRTLEQIHWKAKRLGVYCNITEQRINLGIKHNALPKNKSYMHGYIVHKVNGVIKYEHDILAQDVLGRELFSDEIVHHINEIKDDNELSNLCVLSRSDHIKLHKGYSDIIIVPLSELIKR